MSTKDIKHLLRKARRQGFTVRRARSGHYRLTSPAGATITIAATPSGPGGIHRARADLKRLGAQL